jgi:HNH endonuclease
MGSMAVGGDNRRAATRSKPRLVSVLAATVRSVLDQSLLERQADIERFLAANPGVDISLLRPRVFPCYTYLPGEECGFCCGERDGRRCLQSPECKFRYRAGLFTRQGGVCPWCAAPLPPDLNTVIAKGPAVSVDHIVPTLRGGPDLEWNKQLVHGKCNASKGAHVTAGAFALAAVHGIKVLDFVPVCDEPAPWPRDAPTHLLAPLRNGKDGRTRWIVDRVGPLPRALCGRELDTGWLPVHGSRPPSATCNRCRERRTQLGPGNVPGCPYSCCAPAG